MCGIAGVMAQQEAVVRQSLPAMIAAQIHRGPDDQGDSVFPFGRGFIGLGQRRLSIIDLSPAGHQPMVHPQSGDQIIFNGEIYNFQELRGELERAGEVFFGNSDTEVMLRALTLWGPQALGRFEGMYAFAFWNKRENRLLLGRDPMGIKPLYTAEVALSQGGRALLFASELRAILASRLVEPTLDRAGVAMLLAYGVTQQPATLFADIRSFPPGCYQIFEPATNQPAFYKPVSVPQPFWRFPPPDPGITPADAVAQLRTTLDAAVQRHLVADVPVGVFLSSGLDSTIIAGLAARHTPHLRSFTVALAEQPEMSESDLAQKTAQLWGLRHTSIQLGSAEALAATRSWLEAIDRPSVDGLNVYVISKAVRAQGIVVALSGQGGDELFGGYPSFQQVPALWKGMRRIRWLPGVGRAALGRLATLRQSQAAADKFADMLRSDGSILSLSLQRRRAMSTAQLAALGLAALPLGLSPDFQPPSALEPFSGPAAQMDTDPVRSISQIESRFYQGNMLLLDADANSMAHSLEIRVPLLDRRMLDFAHALPGPLRLPGGRADKHLLRAAFGDLLRPELLQQRKKGFALPIAQWMGGPLRDWCQAALESVKSLDLLQPAGVDAVWGAYAAAPASQAWSRAFTLCVLGHYVKKVRAGR